MPTARVMSTVALVVAWLTVVAGIAMLGMHGPNVAWSGQWIIDLTWSCTWGAFATVGYIIHREQPTHPIGRMFLVAGLLGCLGVADVGLTEWLAGNAGEVAAVAGWVSTWLYAPTIGLFVWSLTLFPTGRPLGRGWNLIGPGAFSVVVVSATLQAIALWPHRSPQLASDTEMPATFATGIATVLFQIFIVCALGAMASLIVRFRRSEGVERRQLKWGALSAMVMAPTLILGETLLLSGPPNVITNVLSTPLWIAIAVGIAITRHGLYDIDRIISRTVAYGALTALVAAVYLGSVLVVTAVLPTGSDTAGVAISTVAAAASIRPLRSRVQLLVDQRFNRSRYDATRTVETFAKRVQDHVDLDALHHEITTTLAAALQPVRVALWIPRPPSPDGAATPGRGTASGWSSSGGVTPAPPHDLKARPGSERRSRV